MARAQDPPLPLPWTCRLLGIGVALSVLLSVAVAVVVRVAGLSDLDAPQATTFAVSAGASLPFTPVVGAACYLILGVRLGGDVSGHPPRAVADTAVRLGLGVLAAVALTIALDLLVAWALLDPMALSWQMWRPLTAYLGYCVGFALAGLGLALAWRRRVLAAIVALGWALVVEPILNSLLTAWAVPHGPAPVVWVTNLLPASAGRRTMFSPYEMFAGLDSGIAVWGVGASAAVFFAWVLLVAVGGSVLSLRRRRAVVDGVRSR